MAARRARLKDVHDVAQAMPHVTLYLSGRRKVAYQVGGKSFVYFRTPRPDAVDEAGRRLEDVIVIWVPSQEDKQALLQDPRLPFFTTPHFEGHSSVLVQASRLGEVAVDELREIIQEAWLSRASARRARTWLAEHPACRL